MEEKSGEITEETVESLAFVDKAIKLDKEKFLEMTQHVNAVIEFLESSRANPVTIYYVTRALDGYARDKLMSFGRSAQENMPEGSTVTAESIKAAADTLFALALEEASKLSKEEQQALVEQQLARKRAAEIGYV